MIRQLLGNQGWALFLLTEPTEEEQLRWSEAKQILFPIEKAEAHTPIISARYICGACNEPIREPSSQSGRSWCNTCGDYVLAEKAINA